MLSGIGIIVVLVLVFLPYYLSGGSFEVILYALPFELSMIGGAAVGGFLIGNKGKVAKATLKNINKIFSGGKWSKQDYIDLLLLIFMIIKTIRTKGMIELEPQIEKPHESELFKKFPRILEDRFAIDFLCDTLRIMSMNMENPYQVDELMEMQIEKYHHEYSHPAHALQVVADALPAIGIVAAVLGVIKTMSSITEPPEVLGRMIGSALSGTFLGVFLSYCFVGPMSQKLGEIFDEEVKFYDIIRKVLVAHLHGCAPQVSVEIGRTAIPSYMQPSFNEVEESQQNSST